MRVKRVAVILLVISLAFGSLMVVSPTARATFIRWVTEWYETHVTYRYAGDDMVGDIPEYRNKLKDYERSMNHYKALGDISAYNLQKWETYKKCLRLYAERRERYEKYCNDVPPLIQNVREALSGALGKLYAENIIYPKYRNMVAVTMIYEYLESGRCSQLEGPDGAYNLYEMELRQNIIIGQLSSIMDNLERIKENQFTLYNEIVEANGNTSSLLSDIGDDIAFSAYQNKAMKDSLETMKYLETAQYLRHR